MAKSTNRPPPTKATSPLDPERLADALRANLARRKAQQRARAQEPSQAVEKSAAHSDDKAKPTP